MRSKLESGLEERSPKRRRVTEGFEWWCSMKDRSHQYVSNRMIDDGRWKMGGVDSLNTLLNAFEC
ncbi:hypothetical protein ACRALDRAFT_2022574 [Sodiomyces alcalophilus JCM 7366]|uniref:uncharacterized protein n=1 Tax=Sodiomyces alcalophilus JCM 7366 TaxID=591952 RepID=UPI0039B42AC2